MRPSAYLGGPSGQEEGGLLVRSDGSLEAPLLVVKRALIRALPIQVHGDGSLEGAVEVSPGRAGTRIFTGGEPAAAGRRSSISRRARD